MFEYIFTLLNDIVENMSSRHQNQSNTESVNLEDRLEPDEIPENLEITQAEMSQRKVLDLRRWYCISRPQYKRTCSMTSIVSCWNYLFSTLGNGDRPLISQEHGLSIVGIDPPYNDKPFQNFASNDTIIKWYGQICSFFNVQGRAQILWKMEGKDKTRINAQQALQMLCNGLRNPKKAFIYHCFGHYMCPIGFDITPKHPSEAYKIQIHDFETSIIVADPSPIYPPLHAIHWSEVVKDLTQKYPDYYDVRNPHKGIQVRNKACKSGCNLDCLIMLERLD